MADKFRYGGQAVIDGVMMRGAKTLATVVRRSDGTLVKDVKKLATIYTGVWRRIPFVRGVIAMLEAMILGMQAIMFSSNVALAEINKTDDNSKQKEGSSIGGLTVWLMLLLSLGLAIGLFSILPLFLSKLILPNQQGSLVFNLVEGCLRLIIFLAYLWGVNFMPDIHRVFSYHGAEHKTIHAYEAGDELIPANVQKYTTAHARCGTAFLLAVMFIAILLFSLVGSQTLWLLVASRILLMPVIAGIAFEITQFGARHLDNVILRWFAAPGLWLQKLTTRQPDDSMVEVAIAALKEVLIADGILPPDAEPIKIDEISLSLQREQQFVMIDPQG
ncbi:MAG: DUF1385 domain-containing protein [Dehalococcoidia bacterium]|nr:DUF1385 domain-containing protein [Dehalococcoidia bacterium]